MESKVEKLIVPVYLNQKIVFDLLAMLQDGISTVTAINTSSSNSESRSDKLSVSFGLNEAFSTLLKIGLSGDKNKNESTSGSSSVSEEKVHTPASLFFKLRNLLIQKGHLQELTNESHLRSGDFIEFEGNLNRNPIVETFDSLSEMMVMAETFDTKSQPKQKGNKSSSNSNEFKKMRQQMSQFSDSLKAGNTTDLTVEKLASGHRALVTVETNFLNDPLMSDLVDGRFKVLGKIIKSVDNNQTISLLRKTALSKMPSPVLLQAFEKMGELGSTQGFNIPEIKWEIDGPAIQIIPIAIYA